MCEYGSVIKIVIKIKPNLTQKVLDPSFLIIYPVGFLLIVALSYILYLLTKPIDSPKPG